MKELRRPLGYFNIFPNGIYRGPYILIIVIVVIVTVLVIIIVVIVRSNSNSNSKIILVLVIVLIVIVIVIIIVIFFQWVLGASQRVEANPKSGQRMMTSPPTLGGLFRYCPSSD